MKYTLSELVDYLDGEIKTANKRLKFFNSFNKAECKDYEEIIEKLTQIKTIIEEKP
jgi:DNA-directed RNA polymerase subunit F